MPVTDAPPRAVLVCAAPLSTAEESRLARAVPDAFVVGVDGGAATLLRCGIVPHLVTGDFDSLPLAKRNALRDAGAVIRPTPDQNFTDLDKALAVVIGGGATDVTVFGASGGRLDHTYAALSALLKHGSVADVAMVDEHGVTRPVFGAMTLENDGAPLTGRTLSLITLGTVMGIHLTGVKWPLAGETLGPGVRDGTSNEITEETVTLRHESGNLLVMVHHAAD